MSNLDYEGPAEQVQQPQAALVSEEHWEHWAALDHDALVPAHPVWYRNRCCAEKGAKKGLP